MHCSNVRIITNNNYELFEPTHAGSTVNSYGRLTWCHTWQYLICRVVEVHVLVGVYITWSWDHTVFVICEADSAKVEIKKALSHPYLLIFSTYNILTVIGYWDLFLSLTLSCSLKMPQRTSYLASNRSRAEMSHFSAFAPAPCCAVIWVDEDHHDDQLQNSKAWRCSCVCRWMPF